MILLIVAFLLIIVMGVCFFYVTDTPKLWAEEEYDVFIPDTYQLGEEIDDILERARSQQYATHNEVLNLFDTYIKEDYKPAKEYLNTKASFKSKEEYIREHSIVEGLTLIGGSFLSLFMALWSILDIHRFFVLLIAIGAATLSLAISYLIFRLKFENRDTPPELRKYREEFYLRDKRSDPQYVSERVLFNRFIIQQHYNHLLYSSYIINRKYSICKLLYFPSCALAIIFSLKRIIEM